VIFALGKKEGAERSVSIRRLGSQAQTVLPLEEAIAALVGEATPPDLKRLRA
jgi:threonyl-tRNA synthetase